MATYLGIDSGKTVVRTALIRTSYRRVIVEALGEADVAASGGEAAAIRAALGNTPKPDASAIQLSGERSFYRRLELPAAAQKEIQSVVAFELESLVPFEMDEAVFDYRVLKKGPGVGAPATIPLF